MSILTHSLSPSLPPCISLWLSFCLCLCLTVCLSLFLLSAPLPHHLSFSFYFTHTLFFFLSTTFPLQPSHWPTCPSPGCPFQKHTHVLLQTPKEAKSDPSIRAGWDSVPPLYLHLLTFRKRNQVPGDSEMVSWLHSQFVPEIGLAPGLTPNSHLMFFTGASPEADW